MKLLRSSGSAEESRAATVGRAFFLNSGGQFVASGCQWLVIALIARLAGVSDLGSFAYHLAILTPVFMFASFKLSAFAASDKSGRFDAVSYLRLSWVAGVGAVVLVAVLFGILYVFVPSISIEPVLAAALVAMRLAENLSDVTHGLMLRVGNPSRVMRSLVLRGVSGVVVAASVLFATGSLAPAIIALAMTRWCVLLFHDNRHGPLEDAADHTHTDEGTSPIRSLAVQTLPLAVYLGIDSLQGILPRLVIERASGLEAVGIFAGLMALLLVPGKLVLSLAFVYMRPMSVLFADGDMRGLRRLVFYSVAACMTISVVAVAASLAFGSQVLTILYGPDFSGQGPALAALLATTVVGYPATLFLNAATAMRRVSFQPVLAAVSSVVIGASLLVLVPSFGIVGAAGAVGLGWFVQVVWAGGQFLDASREQNDARGILG